MWKKKILNFWNAKNELLRRRYCEMVRNNPFSSAHLLQMSQKLILFSHWSVSGFVESGQLIAILGPSGAGKTSLLAAISRRYRGKTSGDLLLNNEPVNRKTMTRISCFVPQFDITLDSLTPYEHLYFMAELRIDRNWTKLRKRERIESLLWTLGLQRVAHNRISTLSGGERKKLNLASDVNIWRFWRVESFNSYFHLTFSCWQIHRSYSAMNQPLDSTATMHRLWWTHWKNLQFPSRFRPMEIKMETKTMNSNWLHRRRRKHTAKQLFVRSISRHREYSNYSRTSFWCSWDNAFSKAHKPKQSTISPAWAIAVRSHSIRPIIIWMWCQSDRFTARNHFSTIQATDWISRLSTKLIITMQWQRSNGVAVKRKNIWIQLTGNLINFHLQAQENMLVQASLDVIVS